jgi:hypothetical protein
MHPRFLTDNRESEGAGIMGVSGALVYVEALPGEDQGAADGAARPCRHKRHDPVGRQRGR